MFNISGFNTTPIRQMAFKNRGSMKGQVVALSENGYNVALQGGSTIKGAVAGEVWRVGDWVTVIVTNQGYSIIGTAASGPVEEVAPEPEP